MKGDNSTADPIDPLEEDFQKAVAMLRAGAKNAKGAHLNQRDCEILIMKLQTSVCLEPLIKVFNELVNKTLAIWRTKQ